MDWSSAMSTAISYPFTIDAVGVVNYTEVPAKIYLDRLLTLLSTNVGQRPTNPEYGLDLKTALFENEYIRDGGNVTTFKTAVEGAIRSAAGRWLPDIQVSEVTISNPDDYGFSQIEILITIPGKINATLTTTTAIFGIDGTITRIQ